MRKKISVIIFLAFISAFFLNEYNISLIKESNPYNITEGCRSLLYNETIYNIDNEYYLSPADNYMAGKGWMRSPAVSKGDYFRRVPGYSLIYYLHIKFFGVPLGLKILKYFQLLLFIVSVFCFYKICFAISASESGSLITALLYGIFPIVNGWIYFTLTESITPFLMVFYVYFIIKGYNCNHKKKKNIYYIISSFFLGYLILTRPYCMIAGVILIGVLFFDYKKEPLVEKLKYTILLGMIPCIFLFIWSLRNYRLTKEIVILEKAFHPETLDRMKPEFEGMFSFAKGWGVDGPEFNYFHEPFRKAALTGDTSKVHIDKVINAWPHYVVQHFSYEKLFSVLKKHQLAIYEQKPYFDNIKALPNKYLDKELEVKKEYELLIKEYKQKFFLKYWILSPLTYLKRMVLHSNTSNLYIFQAPIKNFFLITVKILLFILHITTYLILIPNLIFYKNSFYKCIIVGCPLLFIFFFCFIHREIEQRYMLPALPLLLGGYSVFFNTFRIYYPNLTGRLKKIWNMK